MPFDGKKGLTMVPRRRRAMEIASKLPLAELFRAFTQADGALTTVGDPSPAADCSCHTAASPARASFGDHRRNESFLVAENAMLRRALSAISPRNRGNA